MQFPKWVLPEDPEQRKLLKQAALHLSRWLTDNYITPESLPFYQKSVFLCHVVARFDRFNYRSGLSEPCRFALEEALKLTLIKDTRNKVAALETFMRIEGSVDRKQSALLRRTWLLRLLDDLGKGDQNGNPLP